MKIILVNHPPRYSKEPPTYETVMVQTIIVNSATIMTLLLTNGICKRIKTKEILQIESEMPPNYENTPYHERSDYNKYNDPTIK